jgi:hypothetical protein
MLLRCHSPLRLRGKRVIFDAFDFHVIAESLKVAANPPKAKQTCFHGATNAFAARALIKNIASETPDYHNLMQ